MSDPAITLTHVLNQADVALRVYDLGRRIRSISRDEFERIETLATPYPTPYLQHAWIALFLWNPKAPNTNAVWFLKLPLDEQGFMIPAVRDDILNRLLQNVNASVQGVPQEDSLKDNPFAFKPTDEKMALFHARANLDSQLPASAFYEPVQQFIANPSQATGWENLSLQGLADFTIRLGQANNEQSLAKVITTLPDGLAAQLFSLLEHSQPNERLSEILKQLILEAIKSPTEAIKVSLLVRAISGAKNQTHTKQALEAIFESDLSTNTELLAAISTRCEEALLEPKLLIQFLNALASCDAGQNAFSRILADLMYLPVHRVLILQALRSPSLSDALLNATQQMFGTTFRTS